MDHPYTSNTLAHFVGRSSPSDNEANFRRLLLALRANRISFPPHDGVDLNGYKYDPKRPLHTEELIIPTVTCYCDIPESSLGVHCSKYGKFGVGFSRLFLIQQGARPVMYVPMFSNESAYAINGRYLLEDIAAIYRGLRNFCDEKLKDGSKPKSRTMKQVPTTEAQVLSTTLSTVEREFLAYIKPFNSELADVHPQNYYMEREWRKYGYLNFREANISYVWVAAGFADRLTKEFPGLIDKVRELE